MGGFRKRPRHTETIAPPDFCGPVVSQMLEELGSGGHVAPLVRLSRALSERHPECPEYKLFGDCGASCSLYGSELGGSQTRGKISKKAPFPNSRHWPRRVMLGWGGLTSKPSIVSLPDPVYLFLSRDSDACTFVHFLLYQL